MKSEKTAVVDSVKENYRQYSGNSNDSMHVHYIIFRNGDEGEYHSTSPVCNEFKTGQTCSYSIEQKGFRGGNPEFRIKPLRAGNGNMASQGASYPSRPTQRPNPTKDTPNKALRNENAIMAQHAVTKSVELIACGAIQLSELYSKAEEILKWTIKKGTMSSEEILNSPIEKTQEIAQAKDSTKTRKNRTSGSSKTQLFD